MKHYIPVFRHIIYHRRWQTGGFTLTELMIVILIMSILTVLSLPILTKQVEKAREAEARQNLGAFARAQQAYHFEKAVFAPDMPKLGVNLRFTSQVYEYDIDRSQPVTAEEVHHFARAKPLYQYDLKNFANAVYRIDLAYLTVNCQGNDIGDIPVVTGTGDNDCTDGKIFK